MQSGPERGCAVAARVDRTPRQSFCLSRPLVAMSKLNKELVEKAVESIIQFSNGETISKEGKDLTGKKRKFMESIELQVRASSSLRAARAPSYSPERSPADCAEELRPAARQAFLGHVQAAEYPEASRANRRPLLVSRDSTVTVRRALVGSP